MVPISWPIAGAANITEFNEDGSYKLYVFSCSPEGGYERKPELDSDGRWQTHGRKIITTVFDFETNQGGAKSLSEIRRELAGMSEREVNFFLEDQPKIVVDALSQSRKMTVVEEYITSISGSEMNGSQEWRKNEFVEMYYVKVNKIEPLCSMYPLLAYSLRDIRRLARKGDVEAQYQYGEMLVNGRGVERDYPEAYRLLSESANSGHADAQFVLGTMRKNTWGGVEKDHAESMRWLNKSYEQGNMNAALGLAVSYTSGRDMERDYEKSFSLYLEAAWSGLLTAQGKVAGHYYYGKGVPKDYVRAYAWYKVSGKGHDYVAKFMSDDEVKEAELIVNDIVQKLSRRGLE
uniref:tetratricopeptide repeat protein n=1 Tax=Microbulbifer agarilyticus TaxID=260552 RepID=UPI001302FAE3|nr:tetratricopeptide repeat protein [Microbulbifer agarilyticus]